MTNEGVLTWKERRALKIGWFRKCACCGEKVETTSYKRYTQTLCEFCSSELTIDNYSRYVKPTFKQVREYKRKFNKWALSDSDDNPPHRTWIISRGKGGLK